MGRLRYIRLVLAAVMLVCMAGVAHAEDAKEAPAPKKETAKDAKKTDIAYAVCEEGKKRCEPLKKEKPKYARCMRLACAPREEEEPLPGVPAIGPREATPEEKQKERTCEVGLRKCNVLRELGDRYWLCMDDTCADEKEKNKDPQCAKGKKECLPQLKDYRACIITMCRSDKNCPEGVSACGGPLGKYWDCVSGICLGDVEKYKDPEIVKKEKYPTVPGPDGKPRRLYKIGDPDMPILGFHEKFAYPPAGITQEQWHAWIVPDSMKVSGDILQKVECRNRAMIVTCTGDNMATCTCGDGSRPVTKKEIEEKGYLKSFGGDDTVDSVKRPMPGTAGAP